eukprot:TRINITY_DN4198_c0_g3_i2.p1 TRINITY_DN4198_c0_g3~~TRINITY_DN4198_c0_g3_i2.p1  ORF type:complete len:218 (+),score=72.76 TRINITY_DN4198_c0_g3_i2:177-830(+)
MEKSKKSLSEIYEDEWQHKVGGVKETDKLEEEKALISGLFRSVCERLDMLSNFNYTPLKVMSEVDIKQVKPNISSLTMEEVTPIAVSNTSRLAPEEIYQKPESAPTGESELTREDKKKRRREKKSEKKKKNQEIEKKLSKKEKETSSMSVERSLKKIKSSDNKNIKFMANKDNTNYNNSTAMFVKLQQQQQQPLPTKAAKNKGRADSTNGSANSFKL